MNNITTLWTNPHLRWCVILIAGIELAKIWLPQFKPQLDGSQKIVLFYALAASANSTPPALPPANPPKP